MKLSKEETLCIRMSAEFKEAVEKEAKKEGVTPSEWVRFAILKLLVKA